MAGSFLEEIVAAKRRAVAQSKLQRGLEELLALVKGQPPPVPLAPKLQTPGMHLIAEVKRASPSKGGLAPKLDAASQALLYAKAGASAISVLTEADYFRGSLDDLSSVKEVMARWSIPVLRKDFILDAYQVYESRAYGADALLLIVALLQPSELKALMSLSHALGMDCLVEVHTETEVEQALKADAPIIGINNRDLHTFQVDLDTTRRLRPLIPADRLVVSESGITNGGNVKMLARIGVNAVLVGEALVATGDVKDKVRELLDL